MSSVAIVGIGTWLPDRIRLNSEWPPEFTQHVHSGDRTFNDIPLSKDDVSAAIVARDLALEALDPFLGATRRHVADPSASAATVEALAARAALRDANIDVKDVDLLLSNAIVPDRPLTSTAATVAHELGLQCLAIGTENFCASGVVQLEIARAYIESGLARVVLITQSHLALRSFPMMHPASPGLGDAASAMVVTRSDSGLLLRSTFGITHGEYALAVTYVRGSDDTSDTPWWKAGGDFRAGSRAPELAKFLMRETVSYGADAIQTACTRASLEPKSISTLISVQPRGFIPGAIAERLGLPRSAAVTTYSDIAHVGVCGPVFNLERARKQGVLCDGNIVGVYAQGAGFTRAAAIIEVRR